MKFGLKVLSYKSLFFKDHLTHMGLTFMLKMVSHNIHPQGKIEMPSLIFNWQNWSKIADNFVEWSIFVTIFQRP